MKRAIPLGAGASERDGQRLGRKMERKRWTDTNLTRAAGEHIPRIPAYPT